MADKADGPEGPLRLLPVFAPWCVGWWGRAYNLPCGQRSDACKVEVLVACAYPGDHCSQGWAFDEEPAQDGASPDEDLHCRVEIRAFAGGGECQVLGAVSGLGGQDIEDGRLKAPHLYLCYFSCLATVEGQR